MKIKTQLLVSTAVFSIALLIISASVLSTNSQIDRLGAQEELAKSIELKASELGYLSNNYLLYHESQQIDRWNLKYLSMAADLANLSVTRPDQIALVDRIEKNQVRLKATFDEVAMGMNETPLYGLSPSERALVQISWSRLGVQTQDIVFDSSRLSQKIREEQDQLRILNYLQIYALLGTVAVLLLTNYFVIYRRTLRSVSSLQAGTQIIGSGNLDYTIEEKSKDEFGELSHAFNEMTAQLKTVTASKKDLEQEIVERMRIEEALRHSESNLSKAQSIAHLGIWLWEIDKDTLRWSDETYRILGLKPGEVEPSNAFLLTCIHPGDRGRLEKAVADVLGGFKPYDLDVRLVRRDGSVRYAHLQSEVEFAGGKPVRMVGTILDITDRRLADERVKEAKEQAELYLDLMGHDINNMHQVALGYLELARTMPHSAEEQECLDRSVEVLQRSAQLIDNVRKLQKIREGIFRSEAVDITSLIKDVIRELGTVPGKTISLTIAPSQPCYVLANGLIHDVFSNILGNAIKHSGEASTVIGVNLNQIEEGGLAYYRLVVEDNGPGISDEYKEKVFNRMLQGSTRARGMGLGLYLVKSLIESYNGRIWVEDRVPGDHTGGAKFVVLLPAVENLPETRG